VEVTLDDIPVGEPFDGFATTVSPSGKVDFGDVNLTAGKHRLRFLAAGRNAQSVGYSLGIDCLALIPVAE
jgi:transcription termination factor Rho